MTTKMYSTIATIILGLFSVYGAVGSIFYYKELLKFPSKGDWPFNQRISICLILAVNILYIASAILGLYTLISQRLYMYLWSAFILFGTFAIQLLHGVACVRASMEPMNKEIFSTFRTYQNDRAIMSWLLDFQWQYDCCGIKSYMDWRLLDLSYNNFSVPSSCCNRKMSMPLPNCGHGIVAPNVSVQSVQQTINTEGCGDKISRIYQDDIRVTGFILLTVAFIALVVGIAMIVFHQKMQTHRGHIRRNPHSRNSADVRSRRNPQPRAQRRQGSGSIISTLGSTSGVNESLQKVPSYYKTAVIHKPPTGRGRIPRQGSTRNFQIKVGMQKPNPKLRVNCHPKSRFIAQRMATKTPRGHDYMKTNLEMLMHPIETHSTCSATPNPSDLFPFYGDQTSSSGCFQTLDVDTRISNRGKTGDSKTIAHYNSLPHVVTFPDGRVETLYHYNTSHVHAQNTRRKHSQRAKTTFIEGKFPSLTITSTLATIHEENESVKSGNSQASSTCTTAASSSPKSLSKSSSKLTQENIEVVNEERLIPEDILDGNSSEPENTATKETNNKTEPATVEDPINVQAKMCSMIEFERNCNENLSRNSCDNPLSPDAIADHDRECV